MRSAAPRALGGPTSSQLAAHSSSSRVAWPQRRRGAFPVVGGGPVSWAPAAPCTCTLRSSGTAAAALRQQQTTLFTKQQQLLGAHLRPSRRLVVAAAAASAADDGRPPAGADAAAAGGEAGSKVSTGSGAAAAAASVSFVVDAPADEETYSLEDTKALVETAMLAAVSGLAFLLSTLLKLDSSLGYFLPLPIAIAACRSGPGAAWNTMMATAFLLLVLLGPLRAVTYVLMHGATAAALATMWVWRWPWAVSVLVGSVMRMAGQMGYLLLSSFTMNENLFAVMVANVHNLMDRLSASIGASGAPSDLAIVCMIFALLLVNAVCFNFLMHVIGHIALRAMGYDVGRLPGFMQRYLYGGAQAQAAGAQAAAQAQR